MHSPPWAKPPREKMEITISEADWIKNHRVAYDLMLKIQAAGRERDDKHAAQQADRDAQRAWDVMYDKRTRRQNMAVLPDQVSKCVLEAPKYNFIVNEKYIENKVGNLY